MPTTSTTIGRLEVDHPDLGHDAGSGLHTKIRTLYQKLADNIGARYFEVDALADSASVDVDHNYKDAFSNLRVHLFERNTGTGELTRIIKGGSPDLDNFTIAATAGNLTTQTTITNNTGGAVDIAIIIIQGAFAEKLDDLADVDTTTSAPSNGDGLVFDGTNFVPTAGAVVNEATASSLGTVTSYASLVQSRTNVVASANYTILDSDKYDTILVDTGGSDRTITLPTLADNLGRRITIKKTDSSQIGRVLIDGEGAETIEGYSTVLAPLPYDYVTVQGGASEWVIVDRKMISDWFSFTPNYTVSVNTVTVGDGNSFGFFRREGDNIRMRHFLKFGSTTTVTASQAIEMRVPNHTSWAISSLNRSQVFDSTQRTTIGFARVANANASRDYTAHVMYFSSTALRMRISNISPVQNVDVNSPATWSNNDTITSESHFPIDAFEDIL
jgi:hypothetical protein